mmetsp:Transcript_55066/g.178316  ORF Transcript_55066/g.178316 Transcript_55066/m.178316 type:complete len:387 (+) Transcript_55066:3554-4714(+)
MVLPPDDHRLAVVPLVLGPPIGRRLLVPYPEVSDFLSAIVGHHPAELAMHGSNFDCTWPGGSYRNRIIHLRAHEGPEGSIPALVARRDRGVAHAARREPVAQGCPWLRGWDLHVFVHAEGLVGRPPHSVLCDCIVVVERFLPSDPKVSGTNVLDGDLAHSIGRCCLSEEGARPAGPWGGPELVGHPGAHTVCCTRLQAVHAAILDALIVQDQVPRAQVPSFLFLCLATLHRIRCDRQAVLLAAQKLDDGAPSRELDHFGRVWCIRSSRIWDQDDDVRRLALAKLVHREYQEGTSDPGLQVLDLGASRHRIAMHAHRPTFLLHATGQPLQAVRTLRTQEGVALNHLAILGARIRRRGEAHGDRGGGLVHEPGRGHLVGRLLLHGHRS